MKDNIDRRLFVDVDNFSSIVRHAVTSVFAKKVWWMHRRTSRFTSEDFADPWALLPLIAYLAEETWSFLSPVTGQVFKARFYPDDRSMFGYALAAITASDHQTCGAATLAALCLCDLPAGNLDPVVAAFIRSQEAKIGDISA